MIDTIKENQKSGSNKLEKLFEISNKILDLRPYLAIQNIYSNFERKCKFTAFKVSDLIVRLNELFGDSIED